jgi:hypothetical protein
VPEAAVPQPEPVDDPVVAVVPEVDVAPEAPDFPHDPSSSIAALTKASDATSLLCPDGLHLEVMTEDDATCRKRKRVRRVTLDCPHLHPHKTPSFGPCYPQAR